MNAKTFTQIMRTAFMLLLSMAFFSTISCATFSDKQFRSTLKKLTPETALKLSGIYTAHPLPVAKSAVKPATKNLFYQLIQRVPKDQADYELRKKQTPLAKVFFDVSFVSENQYRLSINYHVADKQVEQIVLNANLRSGMLELDNAIRNCHGVPYVLGGCKNSKVRVGVTQDGNLIVNSAHDNSGALLFVIGSGYSYNSHQIYQRLNPVNTPAGK